MPISVATGGWSRPIVDNHASFDVVQKDGADVFQIVSQVLTARGDYTVSALPTMSRTAMWQLAQLLTMVLLATEEGPTEMERGRG